MARAERALASGAHALDGEFAPQAISSAYYAALYATKALLAIRGIEPNRHTAALRLLGREFVKPGRMDGRYGRMLGVLLESRMSADYDAVPAFDLEEAEDHLEQARDFVSAASALLDEIIAEGEDADD